MLTNPFPKVRSQVEYFLRTDPRCRDDDKWLTYKVMSLYTRISIPFEDFKRMPSFDTIRRVRQKIQNVEGRFVASDRVRHRRAEFRRRLEEWV